MTNEFGTDDFGESVSSSLAELVDALEGHMADRDPLLPTPATVALYPSTGLIAIAPNGSDLVMKLFGILLWTYTMNEPMATWCHKQDGTFEVTTVGYTRNGTAIITIGGGHYIECLDLLSLPVGELQAVSIDDLGAFWDEIYAAEQAGTDDTHA